jgi:hypothetical protein
VSRMDVNQAALCPGIAAQFTCIIAPSSKHFVKWL